MSKQIGDKYILDDIEYEVISVNTETKEDGTVVTVENAIAVSE